MIVTTSCSVVQLIPPQPNPTVMHGLWHTFVHHPKASHPYKLACMQQQQKVSGEYQDREQHLPFANAVTSTRQLTSSCKLLHFR